MSGALQGKTVVVTGASSGLGRHFAHLAAREGASAVVLMARREELLTEVGDEIKHLTEPIPVVADLSDTESISIAASTALERLGPIDVLVNNAGGAPVNKAVDVPYEEWRMVQATNVDGTFLMSRTLARHAIETSRPMSIINISSVLGLRVMPSTAAYATAKAAVVQMTRQLAIEWARQGIRVNALCPGYFPTEAQEFQRPGAQEQMAQRVPMRRLGELGELDGPFLLLASDAGSYITGAAIAIDGGLSNKSI